MKGNSWRKLVTWDKEKQMYVYKENEIFPLSFDEQYRTPQHIQDSYYWDEINRINRLIENKKISNQITETVEESMEYFFNIIGG